MMAKESDPVRSTKAEAGRWHAAGPRRCRAEGDAMVKKLSKKSKRDGAVVSINPHDPPPEPTPGLTAHPPFSARMSVVPSVNTASQPDGSDNARRK